MHVKAVRVFIKTMRVLVETVRLLIGAARVLIKSLKFKAVSAYRGVVGVLVEAVRVHVKDVSA